MWGIPRNQWFGEQTERKDNGMNKAWLDQWLSKDTSVLRRSKADVGKSVGGGNATTAELLRYLRGRNDGPFTVLEVHDYYVLVRGDAGPAITVHDGAPRLV